MIAGITEYGKKIKIALIEKDKTQNWLITEVAKRTGLYFDSSYLHKVMTGELSTPTIISAINGILGLE